jgi:hypothetical protein
MRVIYVSQTTFGDLLFLLRFVIIIVILLSFFATWTCPRQISGTTGQNFMKLCWVIDIHGVLAPLMVTYHYVKLYVSIIIHLEVININVRNFNFPIWFYSNPHPLSFSKRPPQYAQIQHCSISTTFHIWVDYDVLNWFLTSKNFYRLPFSKWPPQYCTFLWNSRK